MVGNKTRRYAFHMKAGEPTVEGLLLRRSLRYYVLRNAAVWEDTERTHSLAGEVMVPRGNVLMMQELE